MVSVVVSSVSVVSFLCLPLLLLSVSCGLAALLTPFWIVRFVHGMFSVLVITYSVRSEAHDDDALVIVITFVLTRCLAQEMCFDVMFPNLFKTQTFNIA